MFPPAKVDYNNHFILRPPEPEDIFQIEAACRESLPELKQFMGWAHYSLNQEKLLERILKQKALYFEEKEFEFGIFDKSSGEFLGYMSIFPSNRLNTRCFEIGFWIATKHVGKGIATLATQILIALIFEHFKGDRVEITCNLDNSASRRVIEKCGFSDEGRLRNYYPEPSKEIVANGMVEERSVVISSLIPEDRKDLPWYPNIVEKMKVVSLLDSIKK